MAFDSLTLNIGSGGDNLAVDSFTDSDAVVRDLPYGGVAFGPLNSPPTPVSLTSGFPVRGETGYVWDYNLKQYNGSAVGLTNALHVQPGTGAVFTVLNDPSQTPGSNRSASGTIAGSGQTVSINTQGCASVGFQMTGAWVATIVPEATIDGSNWFTIFYATAQFSGNNILSSNQTGTIFCSGYAQVRWRCSAYTSGTATITLSGVNSGQNPILAIIAGFQGTNISVPLCNASSDSVGNNSLLATQSLMLGCSSTGTTLERWRNNNEVTALASAARTANTNSADLTNYNSRGVVVVIDVTAIVTSPSITVTIKGKDTLSGQYSTILASVAITSVSTTKLIVYPGLTAVANSKGDEPLPRIWRVEVVHNNGNSITYSIGSNYIL